MNDLRQSTLSYKIGFVWDGFAPLQALGNAANTLSQARSGRVDSGLGVLPAL